MRGCRKPPKYELWEPLGWNTGRRKEESTLLVLFEPRLLGGGHEDIDGK